MKVSDKITKKQLKKNLIENPTEDNLKQYKEFMETHTDEYKKLIEFPKEERDQILATISERYNNKESIKKISDDLKIEYYSIYYYLKNKDYKKSRYSYVKKSDQ